MNKIPLAQRLGEANTDTIMVQLAHINLCEFFKTLERIHNDPYYSDVYYGCVLETLTERAASPAGAEDDFDWGSGAEFTADSKFAEAIAAIMDLPREERARLLHHIIIEPFVSLR